MRKIGHKGADAVVPGNTIASFEAAVELGVEMIELDVLRLADGAPELPAAQRSPLVVAHDWHTADLGPRLTLAEALDAFTRAPLDRVEIDLDLKLPGREDELVAALAERDLIDRAMVSTMERSSLDAIRELEPRLRRGWTYPRVSRDWLGPRWAWARPAMRAALVAMRGRLPALARRELPRLAVEALWVYHPLISAPLLRATGEAGVELIAWTVDDLPRMQALAALGVDGICSNNPQLFASLEQAEVA
ncbi:MAG: glycerophosphoryl diester phosphodiesterase [Solirubrobacterales bacterium]|nr:glycerophosphoryl diester phosphodiesterase [Solirubrobacterales bacterium]